MGKVAFLGIGQAGSNICEVAERNKFKTAVINTSPEDLHSLELVKNKLLVGVEGGSGKDRRIAKNELKSYHKSIINFVTEKFRDPEIELIYIVFSAGGGTGSGMGPLIIDLLKNTVPNKKFGAISVLPSSNESIVALANAYECINELAALSVPTILVDNDKCSSKVSRKKLYDTINEALIDDLNLLLNVKRSASKYGNMDGKDILKILCTPGITTIGILNDIDLSWEKGDLTKQIITSLEETPYAPMELDSVVSRIGFIYEITESTTKFINYELLYNQLGNPLELFEGIYLKNNNSMIISIVSGQSFPISRLNNIAGMITRSKDRFSTRKDFSIENSSLDWFKNERENTTTQSFSSTELIEDFDISSIFSKY